MTRPTLWREFESGVGAQVRAVRVMVLAAGGVFLCIAAMLPMAWPMQAELALAMLMIALWLHLRSRARWWSGLGTLALALLSVFSSLRYAVWRVAAVAEFLHDPASHAAMADATFMVVLLLAEGYALSVMLMGYLQSLWPLHRVPAPLPDEPSEWPAVDVLIPTLNEPLELVRDTALAALNMDWPGDKLKVWLLDDGGREAFRSFAAEAGIGYLARGDHGGAKAGNINHGLAHTSAPYIAVFDCDQAPTRSFLQVSMGWMVHDARLAVVQTPHRFYSADPFARNLSVTGVPGEEQLFHGAIQKGNDLWNAASFCGSCAVLRREALAEIGGMATETVAEDAHTSLRLQKRGWSTAYINLPQSAGLATERLREHILQRVRWARGMMQALRMERPLFCEGLQWQQRLCYLNAGAYFLSALPRLVFLTMPAVYLILGRTALPGTWTAIVAYAIPHLLLGRMVSARMQGRARHAFWNEIYETVMAPYILLPTLTALWSPRRGHFKVTEKGGVVEREFYDVRTALPYLALLALNLAALMFAGPRLFAMHAASGWMGAITVWAARLRAASTPEAVWLNVAWALLNVGVLSVAAGAARENTQRRRSIRVAVEVPADVIFADGTLAQGVTCDLSRGGMRARTSEASKTRAGEAVGFILPLMDGTIALRAKVVSVDGDELRARFGELGLREAEALTTLLYSRADAWLGWGEGEEAGSPAQSIGRTVRLALRGARRIIGGARKGNGERSIAAGIAPLLVAGLVWSGAVKSTAQAGQSTPSRGSEVIAGKIGTAQPPAKDLAMVPEMFADAGDAKPVSLVFAAQPSAKQLQAAGVVASWLGVVRGNPVRFAVLVGTLPAGNAIVLADWPSPLLAALGVKTDTKPMATLVDNPSDAASSALVLTGNTDDELLTAITALVMHGNTWHGRQVRIDVATLPAPRMPDDAPRWLSTDHDATFAQAHISGANGELQSDGSREVTATLRLPPDLYFGGRAAASGLQQNIALHLDYRYNGVPLGEGSTLDVYVNGAYISSTPMPHTDKASEVLETEVAVPIADLRAGDNDFTFRFSFRAAPGSATRPANLMGAVLKDSYLDISGVPHWTRLPELALFERAGYPFTRHADLADTAVVLPAAPTLREIEAYLTLLSRMGAQTGLPAMNVTVTDASAIDAGTGKDLLVLGTPQDQPGIARLNAALPVEIRADGLRLHGATGIFGGRQMGLLERLRHWGRDNDRSRFGEIVTAGELPDAIAEEIEWPQRSAHTAVVLAVRDDAAAVDLANAMSAPAADMMTQSVSVLNGGRFSSYRLGRDRYWAGSLSLWGRGEFWLEEAPWTVAVIVAIICLLIAMLLQARLRRRARQRLQMLA